MNAIETYRAHPGINATAIKAGARSMLHMRHAMTKRDDDKTPAMEWGTLVHAFLLGEADRFIAYPGAVRRGKEYDAFARQAHEGAHIVTERQLANLRAIHARVHSQVETAICLHGKQEQPITWNDPIAGPSKALVDVLANGMIVDLKTAKEIGDRQFTSASWSMGYHLQLAWYRRGVQAVTGDRCACNILAVESAAPFDVCLYQIDPGLLDWAESECLRIASKYRECEKAGNFPGAHPFTRQLLQPAYADEQVQDVPDDEMEPGEL